MSTGAQRDAGGDRGGAPTPGELLDPQRPGEVVELSELLYRGIFTWGLLATTVMAAYGTLLAPLQPGADATRPVLVGVVVTLACALAAWWRAPAYRALRRHPWGMLVPGVLAGAAAWVTGPGNAQLFYVITLALGVTGLTASFGWVVLAAIVAGAGVAMPKLLGADPSLTSTALATVTIPTIFWLIIERLARFVLRLYEGEPLQPGASAGAAVAPASRAAEGSADDDHDDASRRAWARRLRAGPRQLALPAVASDPVEERLPTARRVRLSARQQQVVMLCAEGLNHLQVAACLEIGPQQVRKHLRAARERTGSRTTAQLVAWAIREGLIDVARPANA